MTLDPQHYHARRALKAQRGNGSPEHLPLATPHAMIVEREDAGGILQVVGEPRAVDAIEPGQIDHPDAEPVARGKGVTGSQGFVQKQRPIADEPAVAPRGQLKPSTLL